MLCSVVKHVKSWVFTAPTGFRTSHCSEKRLYPVSHIYTHLLPVVRCCFLLPHFTSGWTMKTLCCPPVVPSGPCCWNSSSTSLSSMKSPSSSSSCSSVKPVCCPSSLFNLRAQSETALACRVGAALGHRSLQEFPVCACWGVGSSEQAAAALWQRSVQGPNPEQILLSAAISWSISPLS